MKINKLIKELEQVKKEHGNLDVYSDNYHKETVTVAAKGCLINLKHD